MPKHELAGTVKLIEPMQTFDSGFTKREFVVTTADDKYPQDIKFECLKDKCSLLDEIKAGDAVEVHFDLRGNAYKDKYYVNLVAWRIDSYGAGEHKQDEGAAGMADISERVHTPALPPDELQDVGEDDDELPF